MTQKLVPVSPSQRIGSLDFLRGIAVLGILVVNIESFSYPNPFNPYQFGFEKPFDSEVRFWVYFLFQGKFFSVFALLFGVGFYIFLDRLAQKGLGLKAMDLYARRLLWLFVFGLVHAYFLWTGDILYHYAICGFFLFPFRSFKKRHLLVFVTLLMGILLHNTWQTTIQRKEQKATYLQAIEKEISERTENENRVIKNWERRTTKQDTEGYKEMIETRKEGYLANLSENSDHIDVYKGKLYYQGILFRTLIMMVCGILLFRLGIFQNYRSVRYYWWIALSVFIIGLVTNYLRSYQWTYNYLEPVTNVWFAVATVFAKEILAIGYVLVLNGLFQVYFSRYAFRPVSGIGKLALTNYIMQTVICVFIFYGYGFARFNAYSRSELLMVVAAIWGFQLIFSVLWLQRFSFGPLEWLWRRLTYGRITS